MRGQLRHVAPLGTLLAVLACSACHRTPRTQGPEAVLAGFRTALSKGDTKAAYALLSPEAQARLTPAAFEAQLRDNPKEAAALQASLTKLGPVRVLAEVPKASDGQPVELVQDPRTGQFRIESPLTDFYPQDTPRAALASFVRAVEGSRWDVVLRLMPEADRAGLDAATLGKNLSEQIEELTRIVALLKASGDAPIEIVGERATMPYGESFTARFLREDDGWKVEDPE
ncbi:MAG: hypothetical protein QM778_02725 [Myxococcales bacterium]